MKHLLYAEVIDKSIEHYSFEQVKFTFKESKGLDFAGAKGTIDGFYCSVISISGETSEEILKSKIIRTAHLLAYSDVMEKNLKGEEYKIELKNRFEELCSLFNV
jgi:hypothetical protein